MLLLGSDAEKMEREKKVLIDNAGEDQEFTVLTFLYDFSKRHNDEEKTAITEYLTKLMEENDYHCSILINNIAVT